MVVTMWQKINASRWTRIVRAWESEIEVEISKIVGDLVLNDKKDLVVWK